MKRIVWILFLFPLMLFAQPQTTGFYKVQLGKVTDGDTFKVYLSCRYKVFCKAVPVRVRGIDTPELRSKDPEKKEKARQAKAFTKAFLTSGKIRLKNCSRDKYFRLLCDVSVDGKNLAESLLAAGLAVPYDGGTKEEYV